MYFFSIIISISLFKISPSFLLQESLERSGSWSSEGTDPLLPAPQGTGFGGCRKVMGTVLQEELVTVKEAE